VNRSIWFIAVAGFLTAIILVVMMLFMLKRFGDSPLSKTTRVAQFIRSQFHFDSVGANLEAGTLKTVLNVHYETKIDSKFSTDFQNAEMKSVAEFALTKVDPFERRSIDEVRVQRAEVRGGGCFQRTYLADYTVPNPYRGPTVPGVPGIPGASLPPK
jgi:hypothetical protein